MGANNRLSSQDSFAVPAIFGPIYDEKGNLVVPHSETTDYIEPVKKIIEGMKKATEEAKKNKN